jgi:penicillin-insensitive murein endopeptidase
MRKLRWFILLLLLFLLAVRYTNDVFIYFENSRPSESSGPINNGRLVNGKRIPLKGKNFEACSWFLAALGRNSVHHKVRNCLHEAYIELESIRPDARFKYGETGWPCGGNFWPHKTHQNGFSVDFMVPVINAGGKTDELPCHFFNRWGYAVEFDNKGKTKEYSIDFDATAAHLYLLDQRARKQGLRIGRVIFDKDFHPMLFSTEYGKKIRGKMDFPVWKPIVRHDEHYHVDFEPLVSTKHENK